MLEMYFQVMWALLHRLKIPFLLIFFSVTFTFLKRYRFDGDIWLLLSTFTIQNFALHTFNNYFDIREDEVTGQRNSLSNPSILLSLALLATVCSILLIWIGGFSWLCYTILFALMFLYSVPLFKGWRIKKVLYLKNLTGSLFWWYLPFTAITAFHTDNSFWRVFMDNTITLAIFIPFEPLWDIKDTEGDLASGIKTIPNQFGLPSTKLLVISAFLLLTVIKANSFAFVVSFLFPLMVMTFWITHENKLMLSQIIISFIAVHTFAANILLPTIIRPYFFIK